MPRIKGVTKTEVSRVNKHDIPSPEKNLKLWGRAVTKLRVSDLFLSQKGFIGHWHQLQIEVNRAKKKFKKNGISDKNVREVLEHISISVVKAATKSSFDFEEIKLEFTDDMIWLSLERKNGLLLVNSKPKNLQNKVLVK